jgi:hypothetical protein
MPLLLQCDGCGTTAVVDCPCPGRGVNGHYDPACQVADLDAALACPPDSSCCKEDHHHGQAANEGTPCRPITITLLPGSIQVR